MCEPFHTHIVTGPCPGTARTARQCLGAAWQPDEHHWTQLALLPSAMLAMRHPHAAPYPCSISTASLPSPAHHRSLATVDARRIEAIAQRSYPFGTQLRLELARILPPALTINLISTRRLHGEAGGEGGLRCALRGVQGAACVQWPGPACQQRARVRGLWQGCGCTLHTRMRVHSEQRCGPARAAVTARHTPCMHTCVPPRLRPPPGGRVQYELELVRCEPAAMEEAAAFRQQQQQQHVLLGGGPAKPQGPGAAPSNATHARLLVRVARWLAGPLCATQGLCSSRTRCSFVCVLTCGACPNAHQLLSHHGSSWLIMMVCTAPTGWHPGRRRAAPEQAPGH